MKIFNNISISKIYHKNPTSLCASTKTTNLQVNTSYPFGGFCQIMNLTRKMSDDHKLVKWAKTFSTTATTIVNFALADESDKL